MKISPQRKSVLNENFCIYGIALKPIIHLLYLKTYGMFFVHILGLDGRGNSSCNVTIPGNVSYNTVGHIVGMAAPADLTCSKNISYTAVKNVHKEDTDGNTVAISHTAVYDEIAPRK